MKTEKRKPFKDNYKAIIEFSGSSLNDLTAVSGSFLLSQPNYPKTESETNNDDFIPENQSDLQYSKPF